MRGGATGVGLGRALAVAVVAVIVDQVSKGIVRGEIDPGESIELLAGVEIVRGSNSGIAFGLLSDTGPAVLVIAAVAFALLLGIFLVNAERPGLWLPVGLLAGGAIGNLIDRVREGAVTDFINPPNWPTFNLADVEITIGALLLIGAYLRGSDSSSKRRPADP